MMRNMQVKPSKASGFGQMIGGIVAMIIGFVFVLPQFQQHGGPMWFAALWILVAIAGTVSGAINAFSRRGIPTEEIVVDDGPDAPRSTESRLRELEEMRRKGLVSDAEYRETRRRVLEEH